MAASVVYSTFGGRVLAENRGGVIRQYLPDPLGNTAALADTTGTITDTYTYWPYGEVRTHIGTSTTPLTFLGTLGYFVDFVKQLYVRARHLRVDLTQWMTVDPLWPSEQPWAYARSMPVRRTDPSGLWGPMGYPGLHYPPITEPVPIGPPNYDWDPLGLTFGYGYCCGFARKCSGCETVGNGGAIDCVDVACAHHDQCVGTWWEYIIYQAACAHQLCIELAQCSCSTADCRHAKDWMMAFYCVIGLYPGPSPGPPGPPVPGPPSYAPSGPTIGGGIWNPRPGNSGGGFVS